MYVGCAFISAKVWPKVRPNPWNPSHRAPPTSAGGSNHPGASVGKNRQPPGWLAAWELARLPRAGLCPLGRGGPGPMAHAANLPPENHAIRKLAASTRGSPGSTSKWHVSLSWYKIRRRWKSITSTRQWERLKLSLWAQLFILLSWCGWPRASNIMVSLKMLTKVTAKILEK